MTVQVARRLTRAQQALRPKPPTDIQASSVLPDLDPVASARLAGLKYVTDSSPGIRRKGEGKHWTYIDPAGRIIDDSATLERIRSLAIPPAYTGVWISPDPLGHIQATGYDARGRKQYRYHPKYREVRDHTKFSRMLPQTGEVGSGAAAPSTRARPVRGRSGIAAPTVGS